MKIINRLLIMVLGLLSSSLGEAQSTVSAARVVISKQLTIRGLTIDSLSFDATLAGNRNDVIPSQKAIKAYVDSKLGRVDSVYVIYTAVGGSRILRSSGDTLYPVTITAGAGITVVKSADSSTITITATGAGGSYYQIVQHNTTGVTPRSAINFSTKFTITDNAGNNSSDVTLAANSVDNSTLNTMAGHTYKGNNTSSTTNAGDITVTQLTADLNLFSSTLKGLVPLSGGGTVNFLRADGTWSTPPTGFISPLTTTGDMIYASPGSTAVRLAIGTNGQIMQIVGGIPAWSTVAFTSPIVYVSGTNTWSFDTTVIHTTNWNNGKYITSVGGNNLIPFYSAAGVSTTSALFRFYASSGTESLLNGSDSIHIAGNVINMYHSSASPSLTLNSSGLTFFTGTITSSIGPSGAKIGSTLVGPSTALIELGTGGTAPGTGQLKLDDGSLLTSPEKGLFEFHNGLMFLTDSISGIVARDTVATRGWIRSNIGSGGGGGDSSIYATKYWVSQLRDTIKTGHYGGGLWSFYVSSGFDSIIDKTVKSSYGIIITSGTDSSLNYKADTVSTHGLVSKDYFAAHVINGFANPMTTAGDIIIAGTSGTPTRLGIGSSNQVLTVVAGNIVWQTPASGFADPLTTNGDIIARISGVTTRLPKGSNNTFLGINASGVLGYYASIINPMTTDGDMIYQSGGTYTRLAAAAHQGMKLTSLASGGIGWQDTLATAGGGVTGLRFVAPVGFLPIAPLDNEENAGANVIFATKFFLPYAITVNTLRVTVVTSAAASTVQMGIYDATGNKLCATSTITSTTTGLKSGSVTSTTLQPGFYWLAYVTNSATVITTGWTNPGNFDYYDATIIGTATNVVSGGVMPSTLGTINLSNLNGPLVTLLN